MADSEKQKVLASLAEARKISDDALALLSLPHLSRQHPQQLLFAAIYPDFISLLDLVHTSCTKLALTLNPITPAYKTALDPANDLSKHIAALVHCVNLIQPKHGLTLRREIETITKDVIGAIKPLLDAIVLNQTQTSPSRDSTETADSYLIRVGAVHDVIQTARSAHGISQDNLAAVRKIWLRDHGSLSDGLNEVREMCEDAVLDADDDDVDDGWDELGLGSSSKLDSIGIERAKKVETIIRLSCLMHERVCQKLKTSANLKASPLEDINRVLDVLAPLSPALLAASDELISALYGPQHATHIKEELISFQGVIQQLRTCLESLFPEASLEESLRSMDLSNKVNKDFRKWFTTCFSQIQLAIRALSIILN